MFAYIIKLSQLALTLLIFFSVCLFIIYFANPGKPRTSNVQNISAIKETIK